MERLGNMEQTKEIATSVYNVSLDGIQMALALTVALAWYAVAKGLIKAYFPEIGQGWIALVVYALIVTLIFVVVSMVIKKILGANVPVKPVIYAVTP